MTRLLALAAVGSLMAVGLISATSTQAGLAAGLTPTTLVTQATPTAVFGQPIMATATVVGGDNPTGAVTFFVFGPDDPTCTGFPKAIDPLHEISGNPPTATSNPFTPNLPGTYYWTANYAGDANHDRSSTACGTPGAISVVTAAPVTPTLVTSATPTVSAGQPISDTATLTNGNSPTGTIMFNLYGPGDLTCAAPPVFVSTVPVAGNGNYTSAPFTALSAGTYRWVATYSGDANNVTVTTACGDPAEITTVTAAPPAQLVTSATPSASLGQPISDTATLSGGINPTGTITFIVYGPDNAICTAPAFDSTVPVAGNGNYSSALFTPTSAGTYRWVATYSGDPNNSPVSTACGDPAEISVVTAAPTTTSTTSSTTTTTAPPGTTTTTTAPPGTTTTTAPPGTTTTTAPPATTTTTQPPATTTTQPPGTTTTQPPPASTTTTSAPPGSTTTTTSTAPPGSTTTSSVVPGSTTTTAPPGTGPTASANRSQVVAGEQVTIFGDNFPPTTPLDVTMFSDPVRLGNTVSDASGGYSVTVTIPVATSPGVHDIVVSGGGVQASTKITVLGRGAGVPTRSGFLARTGTNPGSLLWLGLLGVVLGATFLSYPAGTRGRRRARRRKPIPPRAMP